MKQKKLNKKLTINRTTIANLDDKELKKVKGGIDTENTLPRTICLSIYRTCEC